jgi:hypothetical protein
VRATLKIGASGCGGVFLLFLRVKICRYVDAAFPGWVECSMVDARGREHLFVDKVPAVTVAALDETSNFPQPGFVACVVSGRNKRDDGRQLVRIDAQLHGRTKFEVFAEQLCELPRDDGGR